MKTNRMNSNPECRRLRWPFQRRSVAWLPTLTLCLLGFLLPALGQQDPRLYNTNYPMNTNVSLEATVMFRLYASSTNLPLTYQWQREGSNLLGATNATLLITNLTVAHAGGYTAWITNAIGGFTNTRTATLTVDPTFVKITTGRIVTDREPSVRSSWCDYDGDGFQDLFVANQYNTSSGKNSLYHNNRDRTFTKITTNALSATASSWSTGAWADVDNDGDPDIYVGGAHSFQAVFYRNDGGGRFTAVSIAPTVDAAGRDPWLVAWGDYDNDGWVDLFIPTGTLPSHRLFRNLGNLNFKSMTAAEVGALVDPATHEDGNWPTLIDYDNDGDLDIYFWQYPHLALFLNSGSGFFTRTFAGSIANVTDPNGDLKGPSWADYDNDGYLDAFVSRPGFAGTLHHNLGGTNSVVVPQSGLEIPADNTAAIWGDYDNDGNLDLFLSNNPRWPYVSVRGANLLFRGNGDGTFTQVDVGSPIWEGSDEWDCNWIDYDNDGFLDLFIAAGPNVPEVNYLYRNNLPATGNTNHWLKVSLVGKVSNAAGIGAKVRVTANIRGQNITQLRAIESPGYIGSNQGLLAHFGLGDASNVTTLRVEWPSGNVQELVNVTPDRLLTVTETSLITPVMPSASLNGSVTLTRSPVSGATYQWRFDGVDLVGQTNHTLNLTNIVAGQEGRYSVVASNATSLVTNFAYLHVDKQFTKITADPWNSDLGNGGSGVAGDYDGDGYLDLFISRYTRGRSVLYHNNTNGTFSSITNSTFPLQVGTYWFGPCSDFDNDGRPDLFVWTGVSTPSLFFYGNGDGTFAQVPLATLNPWSMSAVDYDHDGLLDLYVTSASSAANRLYRNLGGRNFQLKSSSEVGGIASVSSFGGAAWADYDDDGWEDVVTPAKNLNRCLLYRGAGGGRFVTVSNPVTQLTISALVAGWGDYDNDGRVDLCVGAFGGQSAVFRNLGGGNFERASIGVTIQGDYNGVAWGDYNNDGFLDLFMTYGNSTRNSLFRNNGNGTFTAINIGSLVTDRLPAGTASYAGLWFDYDNDGFLDLIVPNGNDAGTAMVSNYLYHNNGNGNAWLKVKLVGTTSNREGAGAKVRVRATFAGASRWQRRDVTSGGDPYNGMGAIAHFGLGNATGVTTLRIEWPSGTVQEIPNVATNQILTIVEPRRPVLSLAATPTGFTGVLKADTNLTYQVHASDDLTAGWTVLTNVTSDATGAAYWSDPAPTPQGRRFYKAVKTP